MDSHFSYLSCSDLNPPKQRDHKLRTHHNIVQCLPFRQGYLTVKQYSQYSHVSEGPGLLAQQSTAWLSDLGPSALPQ